MLTEPRPGRNLRKPLEGAFPIPPGVEKTQDCDVFGVDGKSDCQPSLEPDSSQSRPHIVSPLTSFRCYLKSQHISFEATDIRIRGFGSGGKTDVIIKPLQVVPRLGRKDDLATLHEEARRRARKPAKTSSAGIAV